MKKGLWSLLQQRAKDIQKRTENKTRNLEADSPDVAQTYAGRRRKRLYRNTVLFVMACFVVILTVNSLTMDAVTLERIATCGFPDHIHDNTCYKMECTPENGYEYIHRHDERCYMDGVLVCLLPEVEAHEHTPECFQDVLVCGYSQDVDPAVHMHSVDCVERRLVCGYHEHTDSCYADGELICGKREQYAHQHTEDCFVLTCSRHVHTDACYQERPKTDSGISATKDETDSTQAEATREEGMTATLSEGTAAEAAENTSGESRQTALSENTKEEASEATLSEATASESTASEATLFEATESEATEAEAILADATESEATEAEATASEAAGEELLSYTFSGDEEYLMLVAFLQEKGIPVDRITDAWSEDEEAVEILDYIGDYLVMPRKHFEDVVVHAFDPEETEYEIHFSYPVPGEQKIATVGASVTIPADVELPEGTELTVERDIQPGLTEEQQDTVDRLLQQMNTDRITWYEISLGEIHEIEAKVTLQNVISAENTASETNSTVAKVLHVKADGSMDILEGMVEGTDVTFTTDGFSAFGVIYTVDFEYSVNGKMYQFSLPGGEKIALSDLIEVLGIIGSTNNGEKAAFNSVDSFLKEVADVKFSDESLVKVTPVEGDWELESLQPFSTDEDLTITMKNGDVITVKVTDAQESDGVWNLANTSNTQYLHVSADSTVTQNEQERDAAFKLTFTYSLTEDVVHAIDAYNGTPILKYDLNSFIEDTPIGDIRNNLNGVISIGSRKLGTYTIVDGVVTLKFTDTSYFDGRSTFTGFFTVTVQTDETELGTNDEYTYSFPGTTDVIPIHYKKTVEEGKKSVNSTKNDDGSYTLHYSADINVNSDLDSMTFNDTLGGLQSLDASSVKINGTAVAVSQSGQSFFFDVASALGTTGVAKGSYKVTYDTKVTEEQLKAMSEDKTTETNTASWKVNGNKNVPGGDTTIEIDKPREPIPVTKTVDKTDAQPGDTVTYTITYGKDTTALSGFHISDYITDVVIPQGDVTLTYNGQTTNVNFDSQSKDSSYSKGTVTLFDYTFPEGTPGNGPVTATYTVKLIDADTAKANGIFDATEVTNTAQEHRQNTNDTKKTTVTYEKEPVYTVVKSESSTKRDDGKWDPDTVINYTLTIGDADTNMAGVNIKDVMTDLQVLQGDVMIKVGNGSQMKLSDYVSGAMKWSDDGKYSANDVELFNFNMPSNAGNGPVVITYSTKVISQTQAASGDVFGEKHIKNTGSGGKQSDSTDNIGVFDPYPIDKRVTKENADVNHQTVEMGDTVHYTLTYGEAGMNLAGAVIEDQMTDLQKLVSVITVKKADGTSFTMPTGTGQWSEDGNNWDFWDDGKYSTGKICLFKYKLPADIGQGPITIEYDTQIISEAEANESGIHGEQSAFNDFKDNHDTVETEVKIEFPKQVTHNPQVRKEFDHWDVDGGRVYWNIIVEKDAESAYPLENVSVREATDQNHVVFKSESQGVYHYAAKASDFDVIHAIVTTDDGTELTPGVDYSIDKENALFLFPVLNERVHINLAFQTDVKIIDGTWMKNEVRLDNGKTAEAEATYNTPEINTIKYGTYDESNRLVKWEVTINPNKKEFVDSDPKSVIFEDYIPDGLQIVNYDSKTPDSPSIQVWTSYGWKTYYKDVTPDQNGKIRVDIVPTDTDWQGNVTIAAGLSGNTYKVTYYTLLSDAEWDRITSSASGSETFENHAVITAGDDKKFDATDKVTVTSDGYITKTDTTKDVGGVVFDEATDSNSKNITYSIEINPHGYALNNGNTLSLTDYISTNMDLDTASVTILNATLGDDGKLHAGDTAPVDIEVSYNDDSRLLSIREIPDRTPLLLTYTCIARAQGQDTFTNTATLVGGGSHSASTNETHTIQTNDAGVAIDGIEMFIHKIDENTISKDLNGAIFQLYECELEIGSMTNSETYSQSYWDALLAKMDRITAGNGTAAEIEEIKEHFKITGYTPVGDPVTTTGSGSTQWRGLNEHKLYAWKEVGAPEGYTGSEEYHYFVAYQYLDVNTEDPSQTKSLSEEEQTNRKHAAWALDDATQLANGIRVASMANLTTWTATNVESKYTSISATKVWKNDSDNLFETRPEGGIKLQLVRINADGSKDNIGEKVSINVDDDGNWPTYIWNKLPAQDNEGNALRYTVVEDKVENYSTTYSDGGEGKTSGEITVTNRMIPKSTDIHVKKVFDVDEGDEMPSEIKVSLMVIKTDRNGVVGEPEETSYETRLSASNDWSWTFEALPTTDSEGNTLSYTAVEDTATLAAQGFHYIVSYSDNGTGVIETTAEEPLIITNAKETGKITVKKSFSGVTDATDLATLQNGLTVTVRGKDAGGKGVDILTLTWNDVKDDGYEITHLPTDETYTVTEEISADSVLPKYTVTSETVSSATVTATVDGETAELKNVYEEAPQTGSLKLTKVVHVDDQTPATDAEKTLVNGDYVFTVSSGNSIIKYVQITVTAGAPASYKIADTQAALESATSQTGTSALISGLAEGDYVITEIGKNGMTLKEAVRGDGNTDAVSSEKAVTVHVTAGQNEPADTSGAAATFTNNVETVTAKVVKVWNHSGNTGTTPTSLTVTLSNGVTKELNGDNNWTAEVTDLPKYDRTTGNLIEYSWTEAGLPAGYYLSNIQETTDTATGVITTTLTNSYTDHYNPTTTITGKKVWDDGGEGRPDSITVNLYKDGGSTPYRTITVQAPTGEGANQDEWPFEFTNLPVFNSDGSVIQYTVEEILPEGYTDEYGIKINFSQATYIAGETTANVINSYSEFTMIACDGVDLGYIVIRHGQTYTIWTPRPLQSGEWDKIKEAIAGAQPVTGTNQFSGLNDPHSLDFITGVPATFAKNKISVSMKNGQVVVHFFKPSGQSDLAYGKIPYAYTQAGGEGGGTIINTKKNTDIEFGKQWIDISQQEIEWDQDIQVTVSRNKGDGTKDAAFSLVYNIAKTSVDGATGGTAEFSTGKETDPKLKLTITTTESRTKKYSFKIEDLAYSSETDGKYTYYVEETNSQLTGYLAPSYTNTSAPTGATAAYDGGTIINKQEGGYELPSTGGPGTRLFTILGSILTLGAGLLLAMKRKKYRM